MSAIDFKISYTFTVNPEVVSTSSQGMMGEKSSVFAGNITTLENMGTKSTVFAGNITVLENMGGAGRVSAFGIINPCINVLSGLPQNTLSGLRLNRASQDCE